MRNNKGQVPHLPTQTMPSQSSSGSPNPAKPWENLSGDEKVERLKEVCMNLSNQLAENQVLVYQLREVLMHHEHLNGKVMGEITVVRSNPRGAASGIMGGLV